MRLALLLLLLATPALAADPALPRVINSTTPIVPGQILRLPNGQLHRLTPQQYNGWSYTVPKPDGGSFYYVPKERAGSLLGKPPMDRRDTFVVIDPPKSGVSRVQPGHESRSTGLVEPRNSPSAPSGIKYGGSLPDFVPPPVPPVIVNPYYRPSIPVRFENGRMILGE
jgi:hypothetical protein